MRPQAVSVWPAAGDPPGPAEAGASVGTLPLVDGAVADDVVALEDGLAEGLGPQAATSRAIGMLRRIGAWRGRVDIGRV
jgi:hypothetical protein